MTGKLNFIVIALISNLNCSKSSAAADQKYFVTHKATIQFIVMVDIQRTKGNH